MKGNIIGEGSYTHKQEQSRAIEQSLDLNDLGFEPPKEPMYRGGAADETMRLGGVDETMASQRVGNLKGNKGNIMDQSAGHNDTIGGLVACMNNPQRGVSGHE